MTFCGLSLRRTAVMGILNVTPDSFYDGDKYFSEDAALDRAVEIEREGAAILDIGAQSTRPGHTPLGEEEEWNRLSPVMQTVPRHINIPVSVDTFFPAVAEKAMERGAAIINDVSGNLNGEMLPLAAKTGAGLIVTFAGAKDREMDAEEAVDSARAFFARAVSAALRAGLPLERLCLDIGIGFGKTRAADIAMIARLPEITDGLPKVAILCGASRKRVVAAYGGNGSPQQRLSGTVALHTLAQFNGARIIRAHDVAQAVQAASVTDAVITENQPAFPRNDPVQSGENHHFF